VLFKGKTELSVCLHLSVIQLRHVGKFCCVDKNLFSSGKSAKFMFTLALDRGYCPVNFSFLPDVLHVISLYPSLVLSP